jgi:hypothetical protein
MSPPEKAEGPAAHRPPDTANNPNQGQGYTTGTAQIQISGLDGSAPSTRTMAADISLRMYVNTIPRERPHWWLRTPAAGYQVRLLDSLGWWPA